MHSSITQDTPTPFLGWLARFVADLGFEEHKTGSRHRVSGLLSSLQAIGGARDLSLSPFEMKFMPAPTIPRLLLIGICAAFEPPTTVSHR
jgi:hypothetical protein